MARKVFMSVLGSTNYGECFYFDPNTGVKSENVRFIQEAMLSIIAKEWHHNDIAYIFVTKGEDGSFIKNWEDNGHKDRTGNALNSEGLKTRLDKIKLPVQVVPVMIENGNNENEIWQIFLTIYNTITPDDEIYFDITHGFRYLPMLVLVLNNFSKLLKKIKVKKISYGNYEIRDKIKNVAPIVELTSLSNLQDWVAAANMFIETGQTRRIANLLEYTGEDFIPLEQFTYEIAECRGLEIIKGETAISATEIIEKNQSKNPAYTLVKNEIINKLKNFNRNDVKNGFEAVKFCIDHNLIQQGTTLLMEFIVTHVLDELGLDLCDKMLRDTVTSCLSLNKIDRFNAEFIIKDSNQERIDIVNGIAFKVFQLPYKKDLTSKVYKSLSEGARNDINHAGFRINPKETGYIKINLEKNYTKTIQILYNPGNTIADSIIKGCSNEKTGMLINLSNHPSNNWTNRQLEAAKEYGEIKDHPFPAIDSFASTEEISELADQYCAEIVNILKIHSDNSAVHLMGELTFCFALIQKLQQHGIKCIASTTERLVTQNGNAKTVEFNFCRFREYPFSC